jgi:XTP/dITP diphosphohydrolase
MKPILVLATRNKNKLREVRQAIGESYDIQPCPEGVPEVDETADTYEGNARLKAVTVSHYVKALVAADDTGMEVDALGGAPAVKSARFAGLDKDSRRNCKRLIAELTDIPKEKRTGRYRTVVVARFADGRELIAEGTCEGLIATTLRGDGGFGYDPVFIPLEGDGRTFAEMRADEKAEISHRARAFRSLVDKLALTSIPS